jgi:RNA polymerase sigma-70 factor (ECF subfamily)
MTNLTDDYALMTAIAAHDPTALTILYDRHSRLVFTLAMRVIGNRAEAEDLLTEVFWELWSKASRYDPARGSPLTYMLTLTRSRAIDRRRSNQRRKAGQAALEQAADNGNGPPTANVSPLSDAIANELAQKVRLAMTRLEPAQRQAVEMSFFDGLSHTEISQQLGKPLGTIKTYVRQGLIHLREFVRMD